jgi:hypothetical protein
MLGDEGVAVTVVLGDGGVAATLISLFMAGLQDDGLGFAV